MKDKVIHIRFDQKMYDELQKIADKDYRKISDYVRVLVTKVIKGELKP